MKIVKMKTTELTPAFYNPRIDLQPGMPEYEKLRRSILEFGLVEPVVWNQRTGRVVGGHQRLKVLINEGVKEVDVSVVDLSEEMEKALNIALNKIEGDWDPMKLKDLLEELDTGEFDLLLTGYDEKEIEALMTQFPQDPGEEDDFDVDGALEEAQKNTITKPGDIWVLGSSRLICGDSLDGAAYTRLMAGKQANMIFTDPPYNVDYVGKTKDALKIKNDKMKSDQFYNFLLTAFKHLYQSVKPGGAIYICHADSEGRNFRCSFEDAGFAMKQCIIWEKNTIVMGRQDYHWQHEPILYGWKPGASHSWYGGRKQSTIWLYDKPSRSTEHPTMKPVPMVVRAIHNNSIPGDIILDNFAGSGSTLIASAQTDRTAYLLEIDPVYCDVIVKRWEEFTGKAARKE